MKKIQFKNKIIKIYTDPIKYCNCKDKPMGEIPKGAIFAGLNEGDSTGFCNLNTNTITLYVGHNCTFIDLLSTISHELGHLIEGGFKNNPPQKNKYFDLHEQKAEHYENFVLDSFNLTSNIFNLINLK